MQRANDNPPHFRKQDLSLALVGAALVVVTALDPDQSRIPSRLQVALVLLGILFFGAAVWRGVFRRDRAGDSDRDAFFSERFVATHEKKLIVVLIAAHVFATLYFFSPADIVNERPVVTLDHAFHYYQARRANAVFFDTARLHAYDPFFMAGFPSALFDLDVKALEIFCVPFPGGEVARAMKLFILGCYLSMVLTLYAGCRCFRLTQRESILAVALLLVYWHWGRPYASHYRYAGMFSFICVSHLSILLAGLFRRFLGGGGAVWWLILGPVVYFVHPTAVVILVVPFLSLILLERRSLTPKRFFIFALWCLIVVAVNSVWVIPFLEYAHMKTATKAYFQTAGAGELARILFRPSCLPALVLIALAGPGGWKLARDGRRVEAVALGVTFIVLLFVTAYGARVPGLEHLEPGRFLLTAVFFAAPLAGPGASRLVDWWNPLSRRVPRFRTVGRAGLLIVMLSPVFLSFLSARTGYRHRLHTSFSTEVRELVNALQRHVDGSGRLMIEDGPAALYGEVHLPGLLPAFTGVEQIGGPYPFTFVTHSFATFRRDFALGRPLVEFSAAEFRAYVDLYNIRWIVAATAETKDFVSRVASDTTGVPPGWLGEGGAVMTRLWQSSRYTLWRINRPGMFTDREADRVVVAFNRIAIELTEGRESFVLRYHWDEGLEARDPVKIVPVPQLDDPVPFIRVEPNGTTSILIEY